MNLDTNIINKMQTVTTRLRTVFPSLSFVGLIQRSEIDTWDIVIAGDNLNTPSNNRSVAQILSESFLRSEMVAFSGFVLLNSDNPFIQIMRQMNTGLPLETQANRVVNTRIRQVFVKDSYIFFA